MPVFIINANYSQSGISSLMKNPSNRRAAIAALIEKAGGKLKDMYMTTGAHDVLAIAEMPDGADAMAVNMAIAATGVAGNFQTSRAWTPEEFEKIAKKAGQIAGSYTPPGS